MDQLTADPSITYDPAPYRCELTPPPGDGGAALLGAW